MEDRICTDCNTTFEYPYQLERHKKNKKKCTNTQGNGVICKKCKKHYASKYTLERHYDSCKSKNIQEAQQDNNSNVTLNNFNNILSNIDINPNMINKKQLRNTVQIFLNHIDNIDNDNINEYTETVNTLGGILSALTNNRTPSNTLAINNSSNTTSTSNSTALINNSNSNSNNNIGTANITNGNVNNGVINNTYSNMQLIYPFGMENIDFLSNDDKLKILKSPNGLILALKAIYSRLENNNFQKRNLNKDNIIFINSELNLDSTDEIEFRKTLITKTIFLLRRIFFSCKNELTVPHQITVWKNIKSIEDNSSKKHIDDEITHFIALKCQNAHKNHFLKSRKNIDDNIFKQKCLELVQNIINEINKYKDDFGKVSLTDEFIKDESWMRDENDSNDLDLDIPANNVNDRHVEDTPRFRFYNEMEQCELNYFSTKEPDELSVGDIDFICARENKKNVKEYNTLCNKFNPPEIFRSNLKNKLITEPQKRAKDDLYLVQLKNRNRNQQQIRN